jgi:predicted nuclease with TOPRIM domain
MPSLQEKSVYKSPERKLVRFFETSRNKWKTKARESKRMLKRLKNRVRFLETSRARWKDKAKRLEVESAQMKAREHAREAELAAFKKKPSDEGSRLKYVEEFTYAPVVRNYCISSL